MENERCIYIFLVIAVLLSILVHCMRYVLGYDADAFTWPIFFIYVVLFKLTGDVGVIWTHVINVAMYCVYFASIIIGPQYIFKRFGINRRHGYSASLMIFIIVFYIYMQYIREYLYKS